MLTVITPEKIQLPPGAAIRLPGSWQDYQVLNHQLGDRSSPRIKYRPREVLLMAPLPEHGRQANIIAIINVLKRRGTQRKAQRHTEVYLIFLVL
ncbi:hypothetical protein NOS3756_09330 [Nostoc sp. NIES-3756]|uniref:hypothetical protein n=1 Tax=Nostoc sp. NIES-3756 TaxID=1751286 RepID=UPI0007229292|nr:hypothetical protein NOS3756_09330 [Nostoc sp. NIES-3756]